MYDRIIDEALRTPWMLEERMRSEVWRILRFRAAGGRLTAEELQGRIAAAGRERQSAPAPKTIAVVPVYGVIAHRVFEASSGMTSTDEIGAYLRRATADPEIDVVLFDFATPGGTVTGVPELAKEIAAAKQRKYVAAIVNGEMNSAGLFLGAQAHEIVSIPSGLVGSLGTWMLHIDESAALEKEGYKVTEIVAGEHKLDTAPWKPLSGETKAFLQDQVDTFNREFEAAVAKGRGVSIEVVRAKYGNGRVFTAKQALDIGMIDAIETWPQAVRRLAEGRFLAPYAGRGSRAQASASGEHDLSAELPEHVAEAIASAERTATAELSAQVGGDLEVVLESAARMKEKHAGALARLADNSDVDAADATLAILRRE